MQLPSCIMLTVSESKPITHKCLCDYSCTHHLDVVDNETNLSAMESRTVPESLVTKYE
jgi:hypothetical protein